MQVKTHIPAPTNLATPYVPEGRFLHVPVIAPSTAAADLPAEPTPWWRDSALIVGRLTRRPRTLALINTLTSQRHVVEFSSEESVGAMQAKFAAWNAHAGSYTWKVARAATAAGGGEGGGGSASSALLTLDPALTLEANGVPDESEALERGGIDPLADENLVSILLFFNDDGTVA